MKREPSVAVVVVNWNGWRDTIECLESLQGVSYPNYRMIVVDNGSIDDSTDRLRAWAAGKLAVDSKFLSHNTLGKPVTFVEYDRATAEAGGVPELEAEIESLPPNRRTVLIQTGANLGFAGANNVGIRYSLMRRASYVWLLNNDTVVDGNALGKMVELAEREQRVGMVGSKLLYYDDPSRIEGIGGGDIRLWLLLGSYKGWGEEDKGQWESAIELDHLIGTSLLAKREMVMDVGLMDEEYFLYIEETDWCVRSKKRGWRIFYCPKSLVWHKCSKSVGMRSPLRHYYIFRNQLFLTKKMFPYWLPLVFLGHSYRVAGRLLRWEWKALKAIYDAHLDFFRTRKGAYRDL